MHLHFSVNIHIYFVSMYFEYRCTIAFFIDEWDLLLKKSLPILTTKGIVLSSTPQQIRVSRKPFHLTGRVSE